MEIKLITKEQHQQLLDIQEKYSNLTFQNEGYSYPKVMLSKEELEAKHEVAVILSNHIIGYSEFNHFKLNGKGEIDIRLQYNYGAEDGTRSFIGVGYLTVDNLLKGF